jgi:hypothetical protein
MVPAGANEPQMKSKAAKLISPFQSVTRGHPPGVANVHAFSAIATKR